MRLTRFLLSLGLVAASALFASAQNKRLLLVTHSGGFMHDSIGVAEDVLKEVGPKNGYDVTCYRFTNDPDKKVKYKPKKDGPEVETTALEKYSADYRARTGKTVEKENCGRINKETLKNFDAVLFFTTGDPVNKEELADLMAWTKAGGAFAGTHCGADTLYSQPAYGDFIGGYFKTHPPITKVKIKFEDPKHPAAVGFTAGQQYEDEIYIFKEPYSRDKLHIIFSCEPGSFNPNKKQGRADKDYALAWCKEEEKGKVFYTAFGHKREVWKDPAFQQHLFGGLNWAIGKVPGSARPTGAAK